MMVLKKNKNTGWCPRPFDSVLCWCVYNSNFTRVFVGDISNQFSWDYKPTYNLGGTTLWNVNPIKESRNHMEFTGRYIIDFVLGIHQSHQGFLLVYDISGDFMIFSEMYIIYEILNSCYTMLGCVLGAVYV